MELYEIEINKNKLHYLVLASNLIDLREKLDKIMNEMNIINYKIIKVRKI